MSEVVNRSKTVTRACKKVNHFHEQIFYVVNQNNKKKFFLSACLMNDVIFFSFFLKGSFFFFSCFIVLVRYRLSCMPTAQACNMIEKLLIFAVVSLNNS